MTVGRRESDPQGRRRQLADRLAAARAEYTTAARAGRGGRVVQARYAADLDEMMRSLVDAAGDIEGAVVVCAVGGYGRRTLSLHSDIDLLIVFDRAIAAAAERFVNALLQPLWDVKLTVGQHVREIGEFDTVESDNPEFLLALCDLRLLAGDVDLFDDLLARVHRGDETRAPRLISALLDLVDARRQGFNDTLYQLEPDLKNAPGGLRDIAAIRLLRTLAPAAFASRGRIDSERLEDAEEFLLRVRSMLHVQNGRDANVLTHELQEKVARPMGFDAPEPHQQVEALMSTYFRHARHVDRALAWSDRKSVV